MALKAVMQKPKPMVAENTNSMATNLVAGTAKEATNVVLVASATTNAPPVAVAITNQAVSTVVANAPDVNGVNNISVVGPSSARDLLPVTAQMITEYLKPTQVQDTNPAAQPGATVFVPNQMGFTPPVMPSPPSVPESRAVYKSQ